MRPLLILVIVWGALAAVEVPATVVRVVDGDTIVARVGDAEERVRLLWIDTPESKGNAHGEAMPEGRSASEFLTALLPSNVEIILWGPKDELERDAYKRILALVIPLTEIRAITEKGCIPMKVRGASAQEILIKSGWSPYWRKYGAAPEPWHQSLLNAQKEAEDAKAGAWGTAEKWMRDKSNETTRKQ